MYSNETIEKNKTINHKNIYLEIVAHAMHGHNNV